MSDDVASLSAAQMDALREIGNVGAGNSATALSQIISKRIDMNVPRVSIVPLGDVPDLVGRSIRKDLLCRLRRFQR